MRRCCRAASGPSGKRCGDYLQKELKEIDALVRRLIPELF
jgi:hypothetical protein